MAALPIEIIEQILVRLDVRDLIRCKAVSTDWESLISEPRFVKAHLKHSYDKDRNDDEIGERRMVIAKLPYRYRSQRYEIDDRYFDHHHCHLIGSSNGLVCISPFIPQVLVANPSTREVKKLRKPQVPEYEPLCWGFGYDPSIDDYKVVVGFQKGDVTCFKALTLKSNVWKVIGEVNYDFLSRVGVLCNGALHWVMYGGPSQNYEMVILSFDISKEEFMEVPQPDDERFVSLHDSATRLGTIDGCLCLFSRSLLPHKIWMMKEYNVKESWEMVDGNCEIKNEVVHCMKELKHYIPHKRTLCDKTRFCKSREFIGAPIFVESLVSPHALRRPKRKSMDMSSTRSRRFFNTYMLHILNIDLSLAGSFPILYAFNGDHATNGWKGCPRVRISCSGEILRLLDRVAELDAAEAVKMRWQGHCSKQFHPVPEAQLLRLVARYPNILAFAGQCEKHHDNDACSYQKKGFAEQVESHTDGDPELVYSSLKGRLLRVYPVESTMMMKKLLIRSDGTLVMILAGLFIDKSSSIKRDLSFQTRSPLFSSRDPATKPRVSMAHLLLPEILEEVLMRLTVKDLIRCKSVCGSWNHLISDPRFIKAHLKHCYESDHNSKEIGERRIVMSKYADFYTYGQFEADDELFDSHEGHLLGSANGLVCVSPSRSEIVVVNPSIREVLRLPDPDIPGSGSLCWGFGYDASADDYKVVLGFPRGLNAVGLKLFSLRSNSWKVMGEINCTFVSRVGVLCNEALHWVVYNALSGKKNTILSLSISEEKLAIVPQPDNTSYWSRVADHRSMRLGTIDGCLCVFRYESLPKDIWMMKSYNVKESWGRLDLKVFLGNPIYVESLVSPHLNRRPRRRRPVEDTVRNNTRAVPKDVVVALYAVPRAQVSANAGPSPPAHASSNAGPSPLAEASSNAGPNTGAGIVTLLEFYVVFDDIGYVLKTVNYGVKHAFDICYRIPNHLVFSFSKCRKSKSSVQ
ncbi:hypothetical protein OSB04_010482 [Centaurea solstitialis]|uniref:F-box domain-containing protein n=1 Tax=Centaurea solstitialis TaxID=347529 RepID=A0AA38T7N4_9ASTR|nr:hypothetical protein OSB04_010482 [Centaurea solstitialis]